MTIHIKGPTYDGTDPAASDAKRRNDLDFVLERASTADKGKVPFLNASGYLPQSVQGTKSVCIEVYPPTTATAASATVARAMYIVPAHLNGMTITSAVAAVYDITTGGARTGGSTAVSIKRAAAGTAGLDAPTPGTWVDILDGTVAVAPTSYSQSAAMSATVADRIVATNDKIIFLVTVITTGGGGAALGLNVTLEFEKRDAAGA